MLYGLIHGNDGRGYMGSWWIPVYDWNILTSNGEGMNSKHALARVWEKLVSLWNYDYKNTILVWSMWSVYEVTSPVLFCLFSTCTVPVGMKNCWDTFTATRPCLLSVEGWDVCGCSYGENGFYVIINHFMCTV